MNIAFCLVIYNEKISESLAFNSLSIAISEFGLAKYVIIIYDNTENYGIALENNSFCHDRQLIYRANQNNPGISTAYNFGAGLARELGCKWIVFMDQDTSFPTTAVKIYHEATEKTPDVLLKVPILSTSKYIFSPASFLFRKTIHLKGIKPGIKSFKNLIVVNSGLMVSLELFFKVGGYNERLKLDFTDFQFIDKIRCYTDTFEVLPIHCSHEFSHDDQNINSALTRYQIFVRDLKQCDKNGLYDLIGFIIVDVSHLLKLTIKFKTLKFIKMNLKIKFEGT